MKHIGIAGITIPGSLLCIATIMEESYNHFGRDTLIHPRITYTNPPLNEIETPMVAKNWEQVVTDLLVSITMLYNAGVDFVIIPSNSPHYAITAVQKASPIPVISIVDVTVAECKKKGFKKVGILGVNVTMSDGLYVAPLRKIGIEPCNLSPERQNELSTLIYTEIILGKPTRQTTKKVQSFIEELRDMGCDAFIAGCTEIPVVITKESDSPLPFIDTTRLLAKKAFEEALA